MAVYSKTKRQKKVIQRQKESQHLLSNKKNKIQRQKES